MANSVLTPRPQNVDIPLPSLLVDSVVEQGTWESLKNNLRDVFFPEKLPPLKLTSKPVKVREIWGTSSNKKSAVTSSIVLHIGVIVAVVALTMVTKTVVQQVQKQQQVTLVAPDISEYQMPISAKKNDTLSGGGGGGDRDKLEASKGKLPKPSMQQLAPPAAVIRNPNPALPVEPTVVMPENVKLPNVQMPNYGDPLAKLGGPPSNGTGSGGGIGSGSGGGVGSGEGGGVGPGKGGGMGGGIFRVGGGVSAPRALYAPDPEYSEEARKAKYQGVVVLWLIVGPDGRPRDIKLSRPLGMGLDQKAIEAVRQWKFEPAMKDGKPVAVQINVEVNFRLY
jgi:periplasmic protein TonB